MCQRIVMILSLDFRGPATVARFPYLSMSFVIPGSHLTKSSVDNDIPLTMRRRLTDTQHFSRR
jgi:hypothetical protein